MENAVIYARYSSHNQTENSIEAQVAEAKQYARRKKYTVVEVFADRAKTGTNDNREEFQRMLKMTETRRFSVIMVWKVDRFGRNREEIALNKYRCKKNGVRVEYVAENISSGPEGVILESVLEGFAEYYSRQLSQNVKRGIANVAQKGMYVGGKVPYGYKIIDGKYAIDPEPAKKIKAVFKMFNSGYNFKEISDKLNLEYNNVRYYLRNSFYYDGTFHKGNTIIPNIIPPIVTEQEFYAAQSKLGDYTRRKEPDNYILTGKIFCKHCGMKFVGCGCRKYLYYRSKCKCAGVLRSIPKEPIEASTSQKALEILCSEVNIDELSVAVHNRLKEQLKGISSQDTKESLMTKRKRLIDAYEKGVLEMNELSERLAALDEALAKIANVPDVPTTAEIKEFILETKNLKSTRAIVETLVENIIIDPITNEYEINIGLPGFSTN